MTTSRRGFISGATATGIAGGAAAFAITARSGIAIPRESAGRTASAITGFVLDKAGRRVGAAAISRGGRIVAESGADGSFSVALDPSEDRVALTFARAEYVPNTRVYHAKTPGAGTVVVLWPIAHRVTFDARRDFSVELDGSRIHIPAGTFSRADGTRANGPAMFAFTLFDITSALERSAAPGDFSGRLLDRSIRMLHSYGIFRLDATDSDQQPLSIRPGAAVELAVAIPPQLVKKAPKQVGYYLFDSGLGLWMQIGHFVFAPTTLTYNGSITQSGLAHNLDDPTQTSCVVLHVQDVSLGIPRPNATVTAHGPQYSSTGTTNANGDVCLLVETGASFWVEAHGLSGTTYFTSAPFGQQNFTAPNFSSTAADCGTALCPRVGCVLTDIVVGGPMLPGSTGRRTAPSTCAPSMRRPSASSHASNANSL